MNPGADDILIVKPSSLGDIVHTLPALRAIKQHFPTTRISWIANTEWAPLLRGNPDLHRVIEFPRAQFRGPSGVFRFWAWSRSLAGIQPGLALDFQGLLRSAFLARRSRAKRVLGLSDAREGARWFYTETARVSHAAHSVERYLALVRLAGIPTGHPATFWLPEGEPFPVPSPPFIALHPFSRGDGKSLSPDDVRRFIAAARPVPVLLLGRGRAPSDLPANGVDAMNRTSLLELVFVLRRAAFTVSVDSGPMHIAAALPPPLLAIHTWSDPIKVGPYNPQAWIWKNGHLCRMGDYAPGEPSRALSSADVDRIAELATRSVVG